jgi:hypothetical protein
MASFSSDTLTIGIENFQSKMEEGLEDVVLDFAVAMLDYAQAHAPWSDRTGAARAGLDVNVEQTSKLIGVTLFHTVDYGFFLEVRWGGRYAIILPTVETMGPQLMAKLNRMMDGIVFYE